jgi:hypothetical protein
MGWQLCYSGTTMTVKIEKLGIVVPGQVVRKFDGTDTTLTLSGDQVKNLYDQLGEIMPLFSAELLGA